MDKKSALFYQGIFIIISGILLIVYQNAEYNFIKNLQIFSLIPCAVLGFITAIKRFDKQIQFAYQKIHTFTIIIYLLVLAVWGNSINEYNFITALLFIFYMFSEIIFSGLLFNLHGKVYLRTLVIRTLVAIFTGIGTVIIVSSTSFSQNEKIMGFGIIFIAVGIAVLLYKPIMKNDNTLNA